MRGSSIILNHISAKLQGNDLLKDISFELKSGEHLAITGPSGSGKTTLAKVLAGHLYSSGRVTIQWNEFSTFQKKVLLVEQRNQFKNLSHTSDFYYQQRFNSFDAGDAETVLQALINVSGAGKTDKIISLAENFGLAERMNAPLIQLSSGENKRFQFIKAILSEPQILILDSPYTGLDVSARTYLNTVLDDLAGEGVQIILITSPQPVPHFITHVANLEEGRLVFFKTIETYAQSDSSIAAKTCSPVIGTVPFSDNWNQYDTIIDMKNIYVRYGEKVILNNINWQVKQGEKWLLKGRNGAGKSTLLSLINGDNPQAYKNEIYLFAKRRGTGESIWDIKSKIGYLSPELHAFYDKSTSCFNAVASGFFDTVGLYKKLSPEQKSLVEQWMNTLGLSTVQNKSLASLSFGIQRLVLLARAMVKNPELLILDEPCQGLDDEQRDSFIELVNDLSERYHKTLIYVSHYDSEIPDCISKVLELSVGSQKIYSIEKQTEFA